jgi:predicted Fe-Mo cluster-binding NifX family protein
MKDEHFNMKIAIPAENGRLHSHFGGCREFAIVEVDSTTKRTVRSEILPAPEHQPGLFPRWLHEQGVQVVIAGGIGHRALLSFAQHGVMVRAGAAGSTVEALVAEFLAGKLEEPPADCGHHDHHDHHPEH